MPWQQKQWWRQKVVAAEMAAVAAAVAAAVKAEAVAEADVVET